MVMAAAAAGVVAGGLLSGGGPSAPAPVDYGAAAQQQGQANLAATRLSTQINRPNEITPYGSRMWYQGSQPTTNPNYSWTPYGTGGSAPQGSTNYNQPGQPQSANPSASGPGGKAIARNVQPLVGGSGGGAPSYSNAYSATPSASGGPPMNFNPMGGGMYGMGGGTGMNNPGGGTGYSPNDQWTSVTSLSPVQQQLFDSQNRISQSMANTGERGINNVQQSFATPAQSIANGLNPLQTGAKAGSLNSSIGTDGLPAIPTNQSAENTKAYDALMSRQNIQFGQQEDAMKTQLANQGITPGSEAWNRAMQPLEQSRVDATNQATLNAGQLQQQQFDMAMGANAQGFGQRATNAQFGNSAQAQQFAQALQNMQFGNTARTQGLQENQQLRELPLNELNALRSGAQVQAPQFQAYNNSQVVQPAPLFQAAAAQGQQAQQIYGNQVAQYNNQQQGLYGLGSAAVGAYFGA